jgi:Dihydrofolate reductase
MQSPGGPEEDPSNGFAELVDKYRIWVFPSVLGEGKRLFENGVPPRRLSRSQRGARQEVSSSISTGLPVCFQRRDSAPARYSTLP